MHAIVTGGAGFIGSTLTDRLLEEGHSVLVIDNFDSGTPENLHYAEHSYSDRLQVAELDIRDAEATRLVRDAPGSETVLFHLAAQKDVRKSVADPAYDADINIMGSLRLLEAAREGGIQKVVFASSSGTIYGEDESLLPFDEQAPQRPLSPYGISKAAFGDYLEAYHALYGMTSVSLALTNVFGPRQDPYGEAGVVAIFAQRLLGGLPCSIFGDGSATRDYVYVDDVVDAFVRAGGGSVSGLFNIGTGVETSTLQLFQAIRDTVGETVEPDFKPARTGELQRSAITYAKAQAQLGWTPKVNVNEGVERVVAFFRG